VNKTKLTLCAEIGDTINCATSSAAIKNRQFDTRCWICGASSALHWKDRSIKRPLQPEDLRISDYRYGVTLSLLRCVECGFIFSNDKEVDELVSLYEKMSDPGYEESQEGRAQQMRWLLSKARKTNPSGCSLLDVGAGSGLLVAEAKGFGFNAIGVEPSSSLVQLGRRLYQVDLLQGVFPHPMLSNHRFDVIFLVDIIEHVSTPLELLRHCAASLTPQWIIILVTPNIGSLVAKLLGQRWWHFRLAHVGYFSHSSLLEAIERAGLTVVERFSAKWFFRVSYLARRLESYLPVSKFNRLSSRVAALRWLYNRVIPLNLHDSIVLVVK
jgi:2-polyprenyl-3-methyl-5-hydroxy-6-metoxy-1,4-benzoquinol methylase